MTLHLVEKVGHAAAQAIFDLQAELERGLEARRLLTKVLAMRQRQREYFDTRDRLMLPHVKKLESEVDAGLEALRKPKTETTKP